MPSPSNSSAACIALEGAEEVLGVRHVEAGAVVAHEEGALAVGVA